MELLNTDVREVTPKKLEAERDKAAGAVKA